MRRKGEEEGGGGVGGGAGRLWMTRQWGRGGSIGGGVVGGGRRMTTKGQYNSDLGVWMAKTPSLISREGAER